MDSQSVLFFGGISLALLISAYILWGPSTPHKKRKGQIVGLVNLGSTCFLNTLLQALASCAIFVEWLGQQQREEGSLTSALYSVLWVLNGQGSEDSHSPVEVLTALNRHGWVVPSGEQDAHELFHVIISTLQEENKRMSKAGSISDALPLSDTLSQTSDIVFDCPDLPLEGEEKSKSELELPNETLQNSSSNSDIESLQSYPKDKESFKTAGNTEPNSPESTDYFEDFNQGDAESQSTTATEYYSFSHINSQGDIHIDEINDGDEDTLKFTKQNKITNSLSEIKEKKLRESFLEKSPEFSGCYDKVSGGIVNVPPVDNPPFQGLLTSTLQCSACGQFSCLKYDTFDSLSLSLVERCQIVKIEDLIKKFVKTEIISDVECEKCEMKTTAFKTLNFGKLPLCLCLHISRTTWHSYSCTPTKREDYVNFPEYLPLDEYTKTNNLKSERIFYEIGDTEVGYEKKYNYKHLYRLKSVVVHVGGVNSGHFLTYRRGALNTSRRHRVGKIASACTDSPRWYLASDDQVKLSSMGKAMDSLAYILFYEKCALDEE